MTADTVVFLHGLGDSPESWAPHIERLPEGFDGVALPVPGLGDDGAPFDFARASQAILDFLDANGIDRAHLCGLSLGAMVALRFVIDNGDRVHSVTLAAAQVKPSRLAMSIQDAYFGMIPAKLFGGADVKRRLRATARTAARVDFTRDLPAVAAPTLVLCGAKDRLNLPAARQLAREIPDARLHVIPGAGHTSNTDAPEAFSAEFNGFLLGVAA